MNFQIFSSFLSLFSIIELLVLIRIPLCLCHVDELYSQCEKKFSCGDTIKDVGYPFWGEGQRPMKCGLPGFELICDERSKITTMPIMGVTYRVIELGYPILKIAREDVLEMPEGSCPTYLNDSILDLQHFDYHPYHDEYVNITLLYNCPAATTGEPLIEIHKPCKINDSSYTSVLPIPQPQSHARRFPKCIVGITFPIRQIDLKELGDLLGLSGVLRRGFEVMCKLKEDEKNACEECMQSNGLCGYDYHSNQTACVCPNPPYFSDTKCAASTEPKGKKSTKWPLVIGAAVGAAAFILCVAFFVIWRRKQLAAQSKSKDLSTTPPSSNDFPRRPAHNFLQTLGSYPYTTKSDLENGSTYFGVQVFTYAELEEATDNFDSSNELGDGGFGTVYYGKLNDGREVAVKRLYERNFKRVEQFVNEVEILAHLRHQNLVTLYGCTSRRSRELLLVYEYISNGTVADHLHGNRAESGFLRWPARLSIAVETADALAYLHATDIIHRDVKTNNILLDNSFRVKVADFGLSRLFPNDMTHVSTAPQGTPGYVDPEYYHCYQLTNKSDVYSFGVVLVELISSKQAVDTNRHRQEINLANMAISKIQNSSLHELVDPCLGFETDYGVRRTVTLVAELAFRCLQQDRDLRPSMVEVVEVLRGIESHELSTRKGEVVDIGGDDVGLLRGNNILSFSPDSVVNAKWVSSSTTPNSC
ncbi:LEAF RUST 10 DISEASE-RESISTANCE LOCUS RECEPTOR-LIKE PROTEIN KINASE-like 1.4 isoform X1 [Malania oleifera]|uniref:LEAF RUST 10 DISEASE-RESISTANCE LOCUS RECEPTOR-LIKE PROTEIN KINASE-like 1.4 isoform X1 n=1 Tax=Malania oleifera TaxID=397392 RepID=UPI0025AEADB5|nr:LEAF RUST 10 DISEASE-RESISTANCE LOCUS RECEPTOR-LIKE PROTEIN KINASE-like 1.4 isoform X1 [Malania oleifera]